MFNCTYPCFAIVKAGDTMRALKVSCGVPVGLVVILLSDVQGFAFPSIKSSISVSSFRNSYRSVQKQLPPTPMGK